MKTLSKQLVIFVLMLFCLTSANASGLFQTGKASYYGKAHHGKKTASGVRFNMYGLTAAHRTLPFGTKLRVTLPETGKSVIVTVNDRGPFIKGRVLDLSQGAARALGMIKIGVGKIEIEKLSDTKKVKSDERDAMEELITQVQQE